MAHIDDLVEQVSDSSIRAELATALAEMRRRHRFGVVFEEHIPETADLHGAPLYEASIVRRRSDPTNRLFKVVAVHADSVTVESLDGDKETSSIANGELLLVTRFGEPVFPGLVSLGRVHRAAPERPVHPVICGENFHALQLLVHLYERQVDCIYIDPPFNTGARDWKYNNDFVDRNDAWRHSKWLSFMQKRLRLAKRLLRDDGVLVVAVDENEHAHLVMLLEQLFPGYDITSIAIVHNPRGVQGDNFSYTNEFAVFVIPLGMKRIAQRVLDPEERDTSPLRNWGGGSQRGDAKNCFYPILVEGGAIVGFGDVPPDGFHPEAAVVARGGDTHEVWPIDNAGVERKWRYSRESVEKIWSLLSADVVSGQLQIRITKDRGSYRTVWRNPKFDASTHGTQLLRKFIDCEFPFPKSLYAVKEVLYACTADRPNALIVDYFAGSGTTLHATMLLNSEDGGQRRCILVTNNEVDDRRARQLQEQGHHRGDRAFEEAGIFEQVTRPRCEAAAAGVRSDGAPVDGQYPSGRLFSDGFHENVDFYQISYLDPDDVDLGVEFEAIHPGLWLAAGGLGPLPSVDPDAAFVVPAESHYAILFRESRFRQFRDEIEARPDITHVWLVTDSEEAFAEMRSRLPAKIAVVMLYRDYVRAFRRITARSG